MKASKTAAVSAVLMAMTIVTGCGGNGPKSDAGNRPPVITAAVIVPDQPFPTSTLSVQVEASDPEGEPMSFSSEWFVDGSSVGKRDDTQLEIRGLAPGSRVKARVVAADSSGASQPFDTPEVTVTENLSGIDSVVFSPSPVRTGTTSLAAVPYLSKGASANTKLIYHWTVADKTLTETGPRISLSGLKTGDKITVEATAAIGGKQGNPYRVTAVVTNDAPVVQSIAVASQDSAVITYRITATDPDNDPLSYQLVSGPAGVSVDATGLITVPRAAAGKSIRIKVGDNAGNWIERNLETGP